MGYPKKTSILQKIQCFFATFFLPTLHRRYPNHRRWVTVYLVKLYRYSMGKKIKIFTQIYERVHVYSCTEGGQSYDLYSKRQIVIPKKTQKIVLRRFANFFQKIGQNRRASAEIYAVFSPDFPFYGEGRGIFFCLILVNALHWQQMRKKTGDT